MGNAHAHSNEQLPVIVVGGGHPHRGYVDLSDKDIPLCNLYVDLAQKMGVESDSFGTSTGTLAELA